MKRLETRVETLRRRASESLEGSKYPMEAESLLERLVAVALEGSDDAVFAHRHLAELRLERSPWKAALHLRKVLAARPDDHIPHALMGLCQALLSNYGMAIASYQRAVKLAPNVAGYHHNLGHFLDIAMDQPKRAVTHLKRAYKLNPLNADIASSYAHGLARVGSLDEALELAQGAAKSAPGDEGHKKLVAWIQAGAPDVDASTGADDPWTQVTHLLRRNASNPEAAIRLSDRLLRCGVPWSNAAAMAAALDYLTSRNQSQRSVAARHGVGVSTLAKRAALARAALGQ